MTLIPDPLPKPPATEIEFAPELPIVDSPSGEELAEAPAHVLSDIGNAEQLVARHGRDLRYVHPWATWLVWDGRRWSPDETGTPEALVKETLRWLTASANEIADDDRRKRLLRFLLDSERASRVRAALEMARSEAGIPTLPADLDRDPWLLSVGNGTLDLRTGDLRDHQREDLISRQIETPYDADAASPRWQEFLRRVLDGDDDLIQFLQRAAGYSLTGSTSEQILLILYGSGANGKTTFLDVLLDLLGDYAQQAPAETFLERRDSIPNDVARLRGARMVAAAELGEGRRLNEPLVKRLTGGDRIAARFLRAEWFEFVPQFTPWLATNHKPEIAGVDLGIWRRIRLVPFTVTIPEPERDQELATKLRDELPGILAWAVQGCLEWQQYGLDAPEAVVAATAEYRDEQDVIGLFIAECCDLGPDLRVSPAALHTRLGYWAQENGIEPISPTTLGKRLRDRGFISARDGKSRWWTGIGLPQADA